VPSRRERTRRNTPHDISVTRVRQNQYGLTAAIIRNQLKKLADDRIGALVLGGGACGPACGGTEPDGMGPGSSVGEIAETSRRSQRRVRTSKSQ
jgi:hypothetical protein